MTPHFEFAHHSLPLLATHGQQGTFGGTAHLAAVKETCKAAQRIEGALSMAGRIEITVVPDLPDFFGTDPGLAKARTLAYRTLREASKLRWVILTSNPANVRNALPADWNKGYKNVCIGVVADDAGDLSEKLQALRDIPARYRLILVHSAHHQLDLSGKIDDFHWVVFCGNKADNPRAEQMRDLCQNAKVAFHFHCLDGDIDADEPMAEQITEKVSNVTACPDHPFEPQIQLRRPTLATLKPKHEVRGALPPSPAVKCVTESGNAFTQAQPTASSSALEYAAPALTISSEASPADATPVRATPAGAKLTREAELIEMEVVGQVGPDSVDSDTDRHDFERLDRLVRKDLKSFVAVGAALLQIRHRGLWRVGGHTCWADYCTTIGGMTKTHANRLIGASEVIDGLTQGTPIGVTSPATIPSTEWQVRPLCRLKGPAQHIAAWSRTLDRAAGRQPTAKLVSQVVAELMAEDHSPTASKPTRGQILVEVIRRLRKSVCKALPSTKARKEIEDIIVEFANLLRLG